jgi:putative ATP-dependent endonuclease of the OLD family
MEAENKSARILRLDIKRFRGIKEFCWVPDPRLNMIIGGGDTGKSTLLDAIALLFSPTNSNTVSEHDYWLRECEKEFSITAVVELPSTIDTSKGSLIWPWEWNGKEATIQSLDNEISTLPTAYKFRVTGSSELELAWEIIQPNDEIINLPVSIRKQIGVVGLTSEEKNDKDLRLVYGSSLDKLVSDSALRAKIGKKLAGSDIQTELSKEGLKRLSDLDAVMQGDALPFNLSLGLTSSKGVSIGSLIGLLAQKEGVAIPLTSWGSGTRRMTSLKIAALTEADSHIILIDEIERGLEYYRQRKLLKMIQEKNSQSFIATHSPTAISSLTLGKLWYFDFDEQICEISGKYIDQHLKKDPEMFFSKFPILAEGATETGFLNYLLEKHIDQNYLDHGIKVSDAGGNESALNLLESLSKTKMTVFGFVDDEGNFSGRWRNLKDNLGARLLQWKQGCLEENIISEIKDEDLLKLLVDSNGELDTERLKTLTVRAGLDVSSMDALKDSGVGIRQLIIDASTGRKVGAPEGEDKAWKSHGGRWFKSLEGGQELAIKAEQLKIMQKFNATLLPLINSIRIAADQSPIETL